MSLLINPNQTLEENFKEKTSFFKQHPYVLIFISLILLPWLSWTVYTTKRTLDVKDLKARIEDQRARIEEKDHEIQRLNLDLAPFKTIAIERYADTPDKALQKLAQRIQELESANRYSGIALMTPTGVLMSGKGTGVGFDSPVSELMAEAVKHIKNGWQSICEEKSEQRYRATIEKYPDFPFSYYFLSTCLRARNDPEWRPLAQKALAILGSTVSIANHDSSHDAALKAVKEMLDDTK